MISHEEIMVLKKEFEKYFDLRYVLKNDCDEIQKEVIRHFGNDDKRIELLVQQQRVNNWLTTAIAGGIVALLIKVFLGG